MHKSRLGAAIVSRLARWVVMASRSGHRFYVIEAAGAGFEQQANRWK